MSRIDTASLRRVRTARISQVTDTKRGNSARLRGAGASARRVTPDRSPGFGDTWAHALGVSGGEPQTPRHWEAAGATVIGSPSEGRGGKCAVC